MAADLTSTSAPEIVVLDADSSDLRAQDLAARLGLQRLNSGEASHYDCLFLAYNGESLELGQLNSKLKPVAVDIAAALGGQRQGPELLQKAIGAVQPRPSVLDATAGLGRDSAILTALGYPVLMVEEHPVVAALLRNGLERAQRQSDQAQQLTLVHARAEDYLSHLAQDDCPDVIYLDPMFEASGKSALAKKDMQLFQSLLGHGAKAADQLLAIAMEKARYRVVVKRALKAEPLAGRIPATQVKGKAVRFDVYPLRSFSKR